MASKDIIFSITSAADGTEGTVKARMIGSSYGGPAGKTTYDELKKVFHRKQIASRVSDIVNDDSWKQLISSGNDKEFAAKLRDYAAEKDVYFYMSAPPGFGQEEELTSYLNSNPKRYDTVAPRIFVSTQKLEEGSLIDDHLCSRAHSYLKKHLDVVKGRYTVQPLTEANIEIFDEWIERFRGVLEAQEREEEVIAIQEKERNEAIKKDSDNKWAVGLGIAVLAFFGLGFLLGSFAVVYFIFGLIIFVPVAGVIAFGISDSRVVALGVLLGLGIATIVAINSTKDPSMSFKKNRTSCGDVSSAIAREITRGFRVTDSEIERRFRDCDPWS